MREIRMCIRLQYGRDAAHISWAACAFRSLEVYMHERRHHLKTYKIFLVAQYLYVALHFHLLHYWQF